MTLSARNNIFKGGIIIACLSLCLTAACGYFAFQAFPEAALQSTQRPAGITQKLIENFTIPSAYVPFWTMFVSAAFSLISILLILYFFEKTQTPEILYIGLFVISLAFEFTRIVIPLQEAVSLTAAYTIIASRFLLFGRYFGLVSLFAASVYAAGLDAQRQETFLLMMLLAGLVIAIGVPINSLVWDSTYMLSIGYETMFQLVEKGMIVITLISFFIAAYTRSSRNYLLTGIGVFMALAGRNILLYSDTWLTPFPGLALLAGGIWFACSKLHKEYLWL